jgi:RimJ/RimL family protein N-acetyltransferase
MSPESPFHADRIILRPIEVEDAATLHAWFNHPDLLGRRYMPWDVSEGMPLSMQQVEAIVQKWAAPEKAMHLIVMLREHKIPVGYAECDWGWDTHTQSISVVIAPSYQRKGYGSEVLLLLLHYLFTSTPVHHVGCWIAHWNEAGRRFVERHGFQENGAMRRAGIREGRFYDLIMADILRPEWAAMTGGEGNAA